MVIIADQVIVTFSLFHWEIIQIWNYKDFPIDVALGLSEYFGLWSVSLENLYVSQQYKFRYKKYDGWKQWNR